MALVKVTNVGQYGVNKDLSTHELPINAFTDARNIRFLDGLVYQSFGYGEVYQAPSFAPQYILPVTISGARYWIYTTAAKTYAVTSTGGSPVVTDITHATPRTGVVNQWTYAMLSGLPILNVGDTSKIPMSWDLNTANKFIDLVNWPANTYCKSLRGFKNFLIAMNVTKAGVANPFLVMWSHPADPGTLPSSWDKTDTTKDAGEFDLAETTDPIVDGLTLGDSFIVYKESSTHRMDYIGGNLVFRQQKIFGMNGIMNKNCVTEFDGWHFVVSNSDVIVHNGQSAQSVLDKQTRRFLFQDIDVTYKSNVFVFKNPFLNEIFVCYPSIGSTSCDKAMVYNFVDKTVSFRDLPSVNHANYGSVSTDATSTWDSDAASWDSDLTAWNGPDYTPDTQRVLMASALTKLYLLDASASYAGALPNAYLERRGLSFDSPESIKTITGIRPRITGNNGETVMIQVGKSTTIDGDPIYGAAKPFTIGSSLKIDCYVSSRYPAIKFSTGSAYVWRLDSYDFDVEITGAF